MAEHLSEEEQLEALKRWWNENGKLLVAAAAIGLAGFWGWSQYQEHQEATKQKNSMTFQKLSSAIDSAETSEDTAAQLEQAEAIAKQLASEQADTLYGEFAQLYLAKTAVENEDWDAAKSELKAVIDNPSNPAIKDLAKLRLARVLAASGDQTGALDLLDDEVAPSFMSFFAEVKGDILVSQDKLQLAQQAYQKAMDNLPPTEFMRQNALRIKLDNTAVASDTPDIQPTSPHGNQVEDASAGDA